MTVHTSEVAIEYKIKRTPEPTIVTPDGRLLLKELVIENKSTGGIILTGISDTENKTRVGTVVYNGIHINTHKSNLYLEGCKVHFGKHSGAVVVHNNETYISITEQEIAAISY